MDDATPWTAAFASGDGHLVDQHFGMASGFHLYAVRPGASRLIRVLQSMEAEHHMGRVGERVRLLNGCRLLFCCALGEAAKAQLNAAGITALVVSPGTPIPKLLQRLESRPAPQPEFPAPGRPPPPRERDGKRFVTMLADGWDE